MPPCRCEPITPTKEALANFGIVAQHPGDCRQVQDVATSDRKAMSTVHWQRRKFNSPNMTRPGDNSSLPFFKLDMAIPATSGNVTEISPPFSQSDLAQNLTYTISDTRPYPCFGILAQKFRHL